MRFWLAGFLFIISLHAGSPAWVQPLGTVTDMKSPLVEVSPFIFQDELYLLENWHDESWDVPQNPVPKSRLVSGNCEIWIRKMNRPDQVLYVSRDLTVGNAWSDNRRVWVYGAETAANKRVGVSHSTNLKDWSEPIFLFDAPTNFVFQNVGVARSEKESVMVVETGKTRGQNPDPIFVYYKSPDGLRWERVPGAVYGFAKYVGGPSLYYSRGFYYTIYLRLVEGTNYESHITRSKDLIVWQDAPRDRPFIRHAPNEGNASDPELVFYKGETLVYFAGGWQDRHRSSYLRLARYPGTPDELFSLFFSDSMNYRIYRATRLGFLPGWMFALRADLYNWIALRIDQKSRLRITKLRRLLQGD